MIWTSWKKRRKERTIKTLDTWYDWFINYTPKPIRKTAYGLKDKFVRQRHTRIMVKKTVYERRKKPIKLKIQNQSEDNIIKNKRNPFKLKKKMKQLKRAIRDTEIIIIQ